VQARVLAVAPERVSARHRQITALKRPPELPRHAQQTLLKHMFGMRNQLNFAEQLSWYRARTSGAVNLSSNSGGGNPTMSGGRVAIV
jgi:hypothetical protein